MKKSAKFVAWASIPLAIFLFYASKYAKEYETPEKASTQVAAKNWQLCWEKPPEHKGKTEMRSTCLPAKIEKLNKNIITISYAFTGGSGVMEGASTDGVDYDGTWIDQTGSGTWHLKSTSENSAFGWTSDNGSSVKIPMSFNAK